MSLYSSNLAGFIDGLVSQKKALGYSFGYGERVLKLFDDFCLEKYPDEITITKAMGLDWTTRLPGEKKSVSTAKRMAPVRELGKYMQRKGIDASNADSDEVIKREAFDDANVFIYSNGLNISGRVKRILSRMVRILLEKRWKRNAEFWREKIWANKLRDKNQCESLQKDGWRVHIIWECELKKAKKDQALENLKGWILKN